jgi:hypothetical protein
MGFFLIPRNEMCMSDPMPFAQHWEVRIPVPISSIDNMGQALQTGYSSFRPGDLVNVCAFERNTWERLTEIASFRIVSCDANKIEVVQVTETIKVPAKRAVTREEIAATHEVVKMGTAFEVRDGLGNVLDAFISHDQAKAFIESLQNKAEKPVKSEAKPIGDLAIKRGFAGKFIVTTKDGEVVKEFPNKAAAEEYISVAA